MNRTRSPFDPKVVLGLLVVGAGAFLLVLYALGQGWTGEASRAGTGHAASNALPGYSGLTELLRLQGYDVELARNPADLLDAPALILTPPPAMDAEELREILNERAARYSGPTIVILPKWNSYAPGQQDEVEMEDDWVVLTDAGAPSWWEPLLRDKGGELRLGSGEGWKGFGQVGTLPDTEEVQTLTGDVAGRITPLVTGNDGHILVGEMTWQDEGASFTGFIADPAEENAFSQDPSYTEEYDYYVEGSYDEAEPAGQTVIFVFEPDLMNNYGMADRDRARLATRIVGEASGGADVALTMDLTLNGLGRAENLLTLAFRPPFLAATLCLLLAGLVVAWRAFLRFGAPVAVAAAVVPGKEELVRNGARLLQRTKRRHLLKAPYRALMERRLAGRLGLPAVTAEERPALIDEALAGRGHGEAAYTSLADALSRATTSKDLVAAARGLRDLERIRT